MAKAHIRLLDDLSTETTGSASQVQIITDAPKEIGGKGSTFSPTDLLGISLASCMITTLGVAAKKLGFSIEGLTADVEKEITDTPKRRIGKLIVRVRSPHLPSPHIQEKLEQAALHCPVHASLHPEMKIEIDFVWGL